MSLPSDDVSIDDTLINQRLITASNLRKDPDSSSNYMPNLISSANGMHDI